MIVINKEKREHIQSERLIGLDIFRIIATLFVFLFHSHIHIQCQYGLFNEFINMGAIFMTGFYLLSGYALFHVYNKLDLGQIENIETVKNFISKDLLVLCLYIMLWLLAMYSY